MIMKTDFIQDLNLINHIDPLKASLSIDKSGRLVQIQKRSSAANFWHWVIHLITFTIVPRNKDLDAVAQRIISKSSDLNPQQPLNKEEKKTLKGALTKLEILLKSNGSRESKKITQLLKTVKEIQTLKGNHPEASSPASIHSDSINPKAASEPSSSPEIRLKKFLENTFSSGVWNKQENVPQALKLLVELQDPKELNNILTKEESGALCFNLNFTDEKWLEEHAKDFSQDTVNYLQDLYSQRIDQSFYTNLIKYRIL